MLKKGLFFALLAISVTFASGDVIPNTVNIYFDGFHDANQVYSGSPGLEWHHQWSETVSSDWEHEWDAVTGATRLMGQYKAPVSPDAAATSQVDAITGATSVSTSTSKSTGTNIWDAITGATQTEVRTSENVNLTWADHGRSFTGGFYFSRENDYTSYSPSASGSWDFFDRNFTVGLSHNEFFDRFSPQAPFVALDPGGIKRVSGSTLSLTQTLGPQTLIFGSWGYIISWGYLGHPYNPVTIESGDLVPEKVPSEKTNAALSGSLLQSYFLGDLMGSLKMDYRYYSDDWGIHSHTTESALTQYLNETLTLRLRFRYYTQTGAAFAKDVYTGDELYRTADIRFFPFSSYLVGLKLQGYFPDTWTRVLPQRWELKWDELWRDTHGNRLLYQLYSPNSWYNQTEIFGLIGYDF